MNNAFKSVKSGLCTKIQSCLATNGNFCRILKLTAQTETV